MYEGGTVNINLYEGVNMVFMDDALFLVLFWGIILYVHHKLLTV